jgi:hypothetical protein
VLSVNSGSGGSHGTGTELAPPIIVLATAYVIKEQILEAIEIRHANEQTFQTALTAWRLVTAAPEDHP